jgi:hypothetical protein
MFGQDRTQLRRFYLDCWEKRQAGAPLEPMERIVAEVVERHPEYHRYLSADALDRDWTPEHGETNPFLHMGMHIALAEQLQADRPPGLRQRYQAISHKHLGDIHAAEHAMLECLGLVLWEAQRAGRAPDEKAFLQCLDELARQ